MAGESTTPDPVELVRRFNDAWNRRDVDAFLSLLAPEVVYRPITTWPEPQERRGSDEVRRFFIHDSLDAWTEDFTSEPRTIREHGTAVIALLRFSGHAMASGIEIGGGVFRVFRFQDGQIAQIEDFTDRAEALAAAERLAEERGWAMSANLDLVRSIYADWERGEYRSTEWAHPEIENEIVGGPSPGSWKGLVGMAEGWRDFLSAWEDVRFGADEYRELDGERVLVLTHASGRGRTSGLEVGQLQSKGANLFQIQDGKVTRHVAYLQRDLAFADLGLKE